MAGNAPDAGRSVATGKGGSSVSASVGPAGADGAAKQLVKSEAPVAIVAVNENLREYAYATNGKYPYLPESPVPLVRLMLQQTGCVRVVDRCMELDATRREIDLQKEGLTRPDSTVKPRGKVLESQYAVTLNLVFQKLSRTPRSACR